MHRHADRPRLIGDGSGNGLPDPPGGICREFVSLCIVELIDRANQARVALLNEVENVKSAAGVFFLDRHDQTEVCFRQLVLRRLIALAHALGKLHLLVCRE